MTSHAARARRVPAPGTAAPPLPGGDGQLAFDFDPETQRAIDIDQIHQKTGIYTTRPEVDALLGRLGWPSGEQTLLDPGAGNGEFLVAALGRLNLGRDDVDQAVHRVKGYEFHDGAVSEARRAVRDHLAARGWSAAAAERAALAIVENRDYLLSRVPAGRYTTIAANPPYLRLAHLPPAYRAEYESIVPLHARPDLLYAYLDQSAEVVADGGLIGLITADRWLINAHAAPLRRRLGKLYRVHGVCRLDPDSAFYQAKTRRRGTPPRVHPVSLTLNPGGDGQFLGAEPFPLDPVPAVDGTPLRELAEIRLAPWLGPDGIFLVDAATAAGLPRSHLAPAVEPGDIDGEEIRAPRRWALVTHRSAEPPAAIRDHLERNIGRMPPRGRSNPWWLPPEPFRRTAAARPRRRARAADRRAPEGRPPPGRPPACQPPACRRIGATRSRSHRHARRPGCPGAGGRPGAPHRQRLPRLHGHPPAPAGHPPPPSGRHARGRRRAWPCLTANPLLPGRAALPSRRALPRRRPGCQSLDVSCRYRKPVSDPAPGHPSRSTPAMITSLPPAPADGRTA
jgi:hypothetical protein